MELDKLKEKVQKTLNISVTHIEPLPYISSSLRYKLTSEDELFMLKLPDDNVPAPPSQLKKLIRYLFEKKLPIIFQERFERRTQERRVSLEATVLQNWEQYNIDAARVRVTDKRTMILLDYIMGQDYKDLIEEGRLTKEQFDSLIENISYIRYVAKREENLMLLHNDLHIGNFMFDQESRKSRAIDPGMILNPSLNFKEIDAYLNLFFCYSLVSNLFFDSNRTRYIREEILNAFIKTLERPTIQTMISLNNPVSPLYLRYQKTGKKPDPHKNFNLYNTFNKQNFKIVQEALQKQYK